MGGYRSHGHHRKNTNGVGEGSTVVVITETFPTSSDKAMWWWTTGILQMSMQWTSGAWEYSSNP